MESGKDDAVALNMGGFALAQVVGEVEDGAYFIEQVLILNPNVRNCRRVDELPTWQLRTTGESGRLRRADRRRGSR